MSPEDPLFLYEEMILLSLREKEGTVETGAWYLQAVAGALLAELLLTERVKVREDGKKKLVEIRSRERFGDPLLDECLEAVATSEKPRTLGHWMQKFSSLKDLKHKAARGLCRRKILMEDEDRILLVFLRKIYPEIDPRPEQELVRRMEKAIFAETRDLDSRTAVLVSLAHRTGLLRTAFDRKRLKERKERLEQIARGEAVAEAARSAIEAANAAIIMVAVMPTITSH